MYLRPEDRGKPGRTALRIAVVGGVAVALLAILFFRLWDLQILEGGKNLAQAKNNRTRSFSVTAPRGKILDRTGQVLVDNRTSLALQINPEKLASGEAAETAELRRLGTLVHMKLKKVKKTLAEGEEVAAGAPVTLRRDVGYDLIYFIKENQREFPGVTVEKVFVRNYPDETRAAHIVGYAGEVSEEELEEPAYKGILPGEVVGKEGVEQTYDKYLRGTDGTTRYQVNALGVPTPGGQLTETPPVAGDNLKLTINPAIQAAGEAALAEQGHPGGFITMNIHTGQILGLGSYPTFDPAELTPPISERKAEEFFQSETTPLVDRASQGAYPTGSIYKIITALAALENGIRSPSTIIQDNGSIEIGGETFENSEGAINGPVSLVPALKVSSDVYFYTLGNEMWQNNDLQEWSHKLGIGDPTGIDLPVSENGLVPSKKWRNDLFAAGETDRPWGPGDDIQLAVGQGDLQTNPLHMAIAYAALGNGGTIVTPHVGLEIQDAAGRVVKEFKPGPRRHVHINPAFRNEIMEGLHEAAQEPGGTSDGVFGEFPIEIAGKTGTAERPPHPYNQSWYASLAPYPNPRIVTVVTIEEGGFGAEAAAPATKPILEAYFAKQLEAENKASESEAGELEGEGTEFESAEAEITGEEEGTEGSEG
jgi:penicillin-binding protein 2